MHFLIQDAVRSVVVAKRPTKNTALLAQTVLRSVVGESSLDNLLMDRQAVNLKCRGKLGAVMEAWGVQCLSVEVWKTFMQLF